MGEIVAKLSDALAMFWQALDDNERRLLVGGVIWLAASVAISVQGRRSEERARFELADLVAERLEERISRGR